MSMMASGGLVLMPLGLREIAQQRLQLPREGGRDDCLGQNTESGTLVGLVDAKLGANVGEESLPGADTSGVGDDLGRDPGHTG